MCTVFSVKPSPISAVAYVEYGVCYYNSAAALPDRPASAELQYFCRLTVAPTLFCRMPRCVVPSITDAFNAGSSLTVSSGRSVVAARAVVSFGPDKGTIDRNHERTRKNSMYLGVCVGRTISPSFCARSTRTIQSYRVFRRAAQAWMLRRTRLCKDRRMRASTA